MPNQRAAGARERSGVATANGVPWWGAILIALSATLLGIGIEAGFGHQDLGGIFAGLYALGCVVAVLAVSRSGIFTAVIQPPLLLFVGVPLAYYLIHESTFSGLKDAIITCGYPLIERFPLMLFTSSAVLLVGLVRWYLVISGPSRPSAAEARRPGRLSGLSTALAAAFAGNGSADGEPGTRPARPRHVADRAEANRPRPPLDRRTKTARRPVEQTGRPPQPGEPPRRRQPARQAGRDERRSAETRRSREPRRPPPQRGRPVEREPTAPRPARGGRSDPREAGRDYPPRPQYGPNPPGHEQWRRPVPGPPAGAYHPVSRVRYRDSGPVDGPYEPGPPRSRPRR